MSAKGGITKGKSHKEGGIPMVVKSTNQKVELEGGEGVINKKSMADTEKHTFDGKQLTKCEIVSEINSDKNNGVEIDCDGIVGKKYKYDEGGNVTESDNQKIEMVDNFKPTIDDELENLDNLVGETLLDYELQKVKRKAKKFKSGGVSKSNLNKKVVYVVLDNYFPCYTYDEYGNIVSAESFKPNTLYRLVYYKIENNEVFFGLDELEESLFVYIDEDIVNIVGFNENVNGIEPYQFFKNDNEWSLSQNDIDILEKIRTRKKYSVIDKYEITNFRGDNLANHLSTNLIKLVYSLMFKSKQTDKEIKTILIKNNGVGNLLALAPTYADNVYAFNVESKYQEIEFIINRIVNQRVSNKSNDAEIDAIINVYKDSDPTIDISMSEFKNYEFKQLIFVGVAEFTTTESYDKFYKSIESNKEDRQIKMYKINEGISENGKITLIYNIAN